MDLLWGQDEVPALTAALLLTVATSAAGQSLVATTKTPLQVAASYGYSQVHHDGKWIRVDVAVASDRNGTMRLHEAFSLLTPDGERIDLPNQREYRSGFAEIQAMEPRATNMQLSPRTAFVGGGPRFLSDVGEFRFRHGDQWGNGGIDWTATIGPNNLGSAALYFHSPDGWPAGEYWLEVDGPGDLGVRLPVRLH